MTTSKLSVTLIHFGKTGPDEGWEREGPLMSTHGHVLLCSMFQNARKLLDRWDGLLKGIKCIQYYNKVISEGWRGGGGCRQLPPWIPKGVQKWIGRSLNMLKV